MALVWGDQTDTTNAVVQAKPSYFNYLWDTYPHTTLQASGLAVGLPEGQMGNSEVGHLNLGSGRIVISRLNAYYEGCREWASFFKNL